MTKNPSNPCVIEQSSEKTDIDFFIADKDKYKAVFEIYGFIGYKHHKLAQVIYDDKVFYYDLLAKHEIHSERDIVIIEDWERIKHKGWFVVQKNKIDWNTLFEAINKLEKCCLKKMPQFKKLAKDLVRLDIQHTTKQIVPLILIYKNMQAKDPDIFKSKYKFSVIAIRSNARVNIEPKAIHIIDPEITPIHKNTMPSRSKETLLEIDITHLRNTVRF